MRYTNEQTNEIAATWSGNSDDAEHTMFSYAFSKYMPDTYAMTYDTNSDSYIIADRYTVEESLDFWESWGPMLLAWQRDRDAQKRYAELYKDRETRVREDLREAQNEAENATIALGRVVTFLGDSARAHSIQNLLCENYERFLDNVVKREANVPEQNALRSNEFYKDALRGFYVNATRTRAASLTVGVSASGFTTGDGRTTVTSRTEYETMTENSTVPLTFDMAEKANRFAANNGWTQGHRAFISEEGEDENSHPGQYYCEDCGGWHNDE